MIEIDYDSYQGKFEMGGRSEEGNKVGNYWGDYLLQLAQDILVLHLLPLCNYCLLINSQKCSS